MCTMDYPKFIVSNQKEESISIQRVNYHKICMYLVFNLGHFKWGHFYLISDKNKTAEYFPIHIILKMAHSSFSKGPFEQDGGQWPHGSL